MRINMSYPHSQGRVGKIFVFALLAGAASSCSRATRPPLYPVQGTVTVQMKPASKAVVVLRPVSSGPLNSLLPHGEVGPDGVFRIGTYTDSDGAPAGDYIVTITWPASRTDPKTGDVISEDLLMGKYNNPAKSQWTITIQPGHNELVPFRLD